MKTVLAADFGGTKCRFAVLAEDLSVRNARVVPTTMDRAGFLSMIGEELQSVLASELPRDWESPTALGVGTAGVVTKDGRRIVYAPNLPLEGFGLAEHLESVVGLPTTLVNDGRASALGEYGHGHAAGSDPLLVLFFGTGIGIGWTVDGKPYEGVTNAAGEAGHLLHLLDGRLCPCGRRGCYEAYCGGRPMAERAEAEIGPSPSGGWTVGAIVDRADDPRARGILREAELAAGSLVATLCTLLNPGAVVLGGGVLRGWPELSRSIEERVSSACQAVITEELRFVPSRGESDSILWGAAHAAGAF